MMAYVAGASIFALFVFAAFRILGWRIIVDILTSPLRRYEDFGE